MGPPTVSVLELTRRFNGSDRFDEEIMSAQFWIQLF